MEDLDNIQMPQVNLKDYKTVECDKCGNVAFIPAMILKIVPGAILGSAGKNKLIPDNVLVCSKCGTIFKKDREYYDLTDDGKLKPKTEENKNNIILN